MININIQHYKTAKVRGETSFQIHTFFFLSVQTKVCDDICFFKV